MELAAWAVVIVCSPLILLFGVSPRRLRGPRGMPARRSLPFRFRLRRNPLYIALTAPRRWVLSTLLPALGVGSLAGRWRIRRRWRGLPGGDEGLWPDAPPFFGGVREPRRPKPAPSAAGVALREPRSDLDRLRQELMGTVPDEAQRSRRTGAPVDQGGSGGLAASAS